LRLGPQRADDAPSRRAAFLCGILDAARPRRHSSVIRTCLPFPPSASPSFPRSLGKPVTVRAWVTHVRSSAKSPSPPCATAPASPSVFVRSQVGDELWARFAELTTETSVAITGGPRESARPRRARHRCDRPPDHRTSPATIRIQPKEHWHRLPARQPHFWLRSPRQRRS